MGHLFTKQGLKIDPDKAKAVFEKPRPEDVEGVQRLNGFVNYLSKFLLRLADHMDLYAASHEKTQSLTGRKSKRTRLEK